MDTVKHYYIGPDTARWNEEPAWLLYAMPGTPVILLYQQLDAAIADAVETAQRETARGVFTQVHVQREIGGAWHTEWCPTPLRPVFPLSLRRFAA